MLNNAFRKELIILLGACAAVRPPALRRSKRAEWLYATDIPVLLSECTKEQLESALQGAGWEYIPAEQLPRSESDVMVESYVRDALIRFNPCIAENPSFADQVIYKLRALISTVRPHDLVTQNERF